MKELGYRKFFNNNAKVEKLIKKAVKEINKNKLISYNFKNFIKNDVKLINILQTLQIQEVGGKNQTLVNGL